MSMTSPLLSTWLYSGILYMPQFLTSVQVAYCRGQARCRLQACTPIAAEQHQLHACRVAPAVWEDGSAGGNVRATAAHW